MRSPVTACGPAARCSPPRGRTWPAACGPRTRWSHAGGRLERVQQRSGRRRGGAGPGPPRRPRPRDRAAGAPAVSGTRPSSASSRVVLPLPLGPTMATRSAQPISRSTGPSVKSPRSTTAPSSAATTSPLRVGLPRSRTGGPSSPRACRTTSRPSQRLLGPSGLGRQVLASPRCGSVGRSCRCRRALVALGPARWWPTGAAAAPAPRASPLGGVVGVGLLGVATGRRPLLEVGQPAAPKRVVRRVCSSSSITSVTVRSRNARSWLTTTSARLCSSTHDSRRSRPPRSKSLVGSSSSTTSWPARRSEASDALAASPPERVVIARSRSGGWSPSVASTSSTRMSWSATPSPNHRCSAAS